MWVVLIVFLFIFIVLIYCMCAAGQHNTPKDDEEQIAWLKTFYSNKGKRNE